MWKGIYGEFVKTPVDSSIFWALVDEMTDGQSEFHPMKNPCGFLDAFKNGNLYTLAVRETDEMYRLGSRADPIFVPGKFYILPCCIIVEHIAEGVKVEWLWVHPRARRLGIASALVGMFDPVCTSRQLADSRGFWESFGIPEIEFMQAVNEKRI